MKRFACLVALLALSSPASARAYSFTFHGHHVHIGAHCRSLSCVSVSGSGHNRHDAEDDVATTNDTTLAPAQAQPAPVAAPQAQPVPARPALATAQNPAPMITRAQTIPPVVRAPPAPVAAVAPPAPPPSVGFETVKPQQIQALPAPVAAGKPVAKPQDAPAARQTVAPVVRVSHESDDVAADSALGDWQTDAKKGTLVHIEACGGSLCGYTLDPATRARGETVLVNMKAKNDTQWTGNVYSRTSGNNYYGTMTLKQGDTLRVEACAFGRFFCSGNNWTRVASKPDSVKPDPVLSTQRSVANPRS